MTTDCIAVEVVVLDQHLVDAGHFVGAAEAFE